MDSSLPSIYANTHLLPKLKDPSRLNHQSLPADLSSLVSTLLEETLPKNFEEILSQIRVSNLPPEVQSTLANYTYCIRLSELFVADTRSAREIFELADKIVDDKMNKDFIHMIAKSHLTDEIFGTKGFEELIGYMDLVSKVDAKNKAVVDGAMYQHIACLVETREYDLISLAQTLGYLQQLEKIGNYRDIGDYIAGRLLKKIGVDKDTSELPEESKKYFQIDTNEVIITAINLARVYQFSEGMQ